MRVIIPPMLLAKARGMRSLLEEMVMKMDTGNNFVYFQATRGSDAVRSHVFPPESVKANIWINIYTSF